jgi:hypothetical protein
MPPLSFQDVRPVSVTDNNGLPISADNPFTSALYYWNTDTLSFEVATTPGAGEGGLVSVSNFPAVQAVSVASLPLPSGAATEASLEELTPASNSSVSSVSGSVSSQTFLSSNAARKSFIVYNDSTSTLYLKYGATASNTSYTEKLYSNASYSESGYTGRVDGIWDAATGAVRITELS